jgi:hypothetical protein
MTIYDSSSFAAGQDAGTRVAACLARIAALELVDGSRWWNRWKRRLMAGALVACAEELECAADADRRLRPSRADGARGEARGELFGQVLLDRSARWIGPPRTGGPRFRWVAR